MAKIRFFESNSLKFKRLEDYTSLQNDDTRLYYDQEHIEIKVGNYFQKIAHGEPLWFQFRTDYDPSTITVSLVKDDGTTASLTSSLVTTATLDTGLTQHELSLNVDSLAGNYHILVTFIACVLPCTAFLLTTVVTVLPSTSVIVGVLTTGADAAIDSVINVEYNNFVVLAIPTLSSSKT